MKPVRIELRSETALACYFLLATWRDPATAPVLDASEAPMAIVLDFDSDVVARIMKTLTAAQFHAGSLGESAIALRAEIQDLVVARSRQASEAAPPDTIAG